MSDAKASPMLSCDELEALLPELVYGELEDERRAAVRERLPACAEVAAKVAAYENLRRAFAALPDEEPPAAISAQLMHAAAAHVRARRRRVGVASGSFWAGLVGSWRALATHPALAAAASLLVVAGVAGALYLRGRGDVAEPTVPSAAEAPVASGVAEVTGPGAAPASAPGAGQPVRTALLDEKMAMNGDRAEAALWRDDGASAAPTTTGKQQRGAGGKTAPADNGFGEDRGDQAGTGEGAVVGGVLGATLDAKLKAPPPASQTPPGRLPAQKSPAAGPVSPRSSYQRATQEAEPPVAAEASPAPAAPAPDATRSADKKKPAPSKKPSTAGALESLHAKARAAASLGDCGRARGFGDEIRTLDAAYYRDTFLTDARLRDCPDLDAAAKKRAEEARRGGSTSGRAGGARWRSARARAPGAGRMVGHDQSVP
jgi:anti-sigma factor RsiW